MSTLKTNKSSDIFKFGNTLSMFVEAGFLGFVPLMLLCFNVLACFQEASLVSQVIPRIEGSYYKALLYTGIALGAGIMFAPNFVWWRQIKREIERIKAKPDVAGKYQTDYIENLNGGKNKHLAIWLLCISTSILTHGLTLFFCTIAFSNPEVLKSLSMKGMEDVSIAFCIVVTGSCFFLDILLGVFTNAQVDLDSYKPDNGRDLQFMKEVETYNKIEKSQLEMKEKLLAQEAENVNLANNLKKTEADIAKAKKDGATTNPSTNPNNSNPNDPKSNDPTNAKNPAAGSDTPKTDTGTLIYNVKDVDEFYGVLFKNRNLDRSKIATAFKSANQHKFEKEISPSLTKNMHTLKSLFKKKENENDLNVRITLTGEIEAEMNKSIELLKSIGLQPKKST